MYYRSHGAHERTREVLSTMALGLCCLLPFILIVIILILILLPGHTVVQTPPQIQKVYVKQCPKCGAENEASNLFCTRCGNRF